MDAMAEQGSAATQAPTKKPKNIVVCCDGTGNEFCDSNSNVVKLYTAMLVNNDQVAYYHPGVGTMGSTTARNALESKWSVVKGLAFGAGFRDNVLDAYRFLMDAYDDGDQIYIFGFSRGAYTARALAGLIHGYGVLCSGNEGHIPYAWRMFTDQVKEMRDKGKTTIQVADAFKETFSHPKLKIRFVGVWDTVSSIGWVYQPVTLLYTAHNASMECGRHAVSIDERRCFFRDNLWGEALPGQDVLQVWFAGVHSDVGGSYPSAESALSNKALTWMLDEAEKAGLKVNPDRRKMVLGEGTSSSAAAELYKRADPTHPIHKSLKGSWWLLEFLPHRYYDKALKKEQWRIPMGVPRHVPPGSVVHPSVMERMQDKQMHYAPPNVPERSLSPHPGHQPGTNEDLSGYFVYRAGAQQTAPEASGEPTRLKLATVAKAGAAVAGVAAAGTVLTGAAVAGCAVLLLRKLLR